MNSAEFLNLKFRVAQYVLSVAPDTTVALDWPEALPSAETPEFTFVIRFQRREVAVPLSVLDVMHGKDWRLQIDDAMNRITLS